MTRTAAERGIVEVFDVMVKNVVDEFSWERALRTTSLRPGGAILDKLLDKTEVVDSRALEPLLDRYRRSAIEYFQRALDYAEGEASAESIREEFPEYQENIHILDPAASRVEYQALIDDVVEYYCDVGEALGPVVGHDSDEFWQAVQESMAEEQAVQVLERAMSFSDVLEAHHGVLEMKMQLNPAHLLSMPGSALAPEVSVEYTDEAINALSRAEQRGHSNLSTRVRSISTD